MAQIDTRQIPVTKFIPQKGGFTFNYIQGQLFAFLAVIVTCHDFSFPSFFPHHWAVLEAFSWSHDLNEGTHLRENKCMTHLSQSII